MSESAERLEDAMAALVSLAEQWEVLALTLAVEAARAEPDRRAMAAVAHQARRLADRARALAETATALSAELGGAAPPATA